MKRLGALATLALISALAPTAAAATQTTPFTGSWWSIDPVDGSTQHLTIQGGTSVQLWYEDEFGTTCVEVGASTPVFHAVLTGRVDGDFLGATFRSAGCGSHLVLNSSFGFSWFFLYDSSTDTLWGAINDGPAVWHRS
jgi:hypothetical protein